VNKIGEIEPHGPVARDKECVRGMDAKVVPRGR